MEEGAFGGGDERGGGAGLETIASAGMHSLFLDEKGTVSRTSGAGRYLSKALSLTVPPFSLPSSLFISFFRKKNLDLVFWC